MYIPYFTPEVLRRIGISTGVYVFAFVSFFFLSDISTASSLGIMISIIATAVVVNLFSLEFDRLDVMITSASMVPVFFILEYLAFVELFSTLGIIISAIKDVLLYAGFSLITATLALYRMSPEARARLAKEKEEKRVKKEDMFYVPEKERKPVGVSKPEVSLITGKEPAKKKEPETKKLTALEELGKEFEEPVKMKEKKKEKKLSPELEKAAFGIHGLILKGKGKEEVLEVLQKAGFSTKEAQQIYNYASEL